MSENQYFSRRFISSQVLPRKVASLNLCMASMTWLTLSRCQTGSLLLWPGLRQILTEISRFGPRTGIIQTNWSHHQYRLCSAHTLEVGYSGTGQHWSAPAGEKKCGSYCRCWKQRWRSSLKCRSGQLCSSSSERIIPIRSLQKNMFGSWNTQSWKWQIIVKPSV